jgi:RNA polymerase-binding transcription factor DksA
MKKTFITEMKEKLEKEKIRLNTELSNFAHRNPKAKQTDYDTDFPEYGDDGDENANEIATYSNNLPLETQLEKELRDTESTLKRIEDGSYGVCKYCKSDIDEMRLRARATSTSCIACKKTLTQEV